MDARTTRRAIAAVLIAFACVTTSEAATYKTPNFVVTAPTKDFAIQVGKAAEYYRKELAVLWLGKELEANWYRPCPITVRVGQIGAGGATSFQFDRGEVFGWRMRVQGTEERILDSVIPHEVSHMIFASHFRRPLPRWADEGAATLIEHESERLRQKKTLQQVMSGGRRYSLKQLLAIKEYPKSMQRVLTLYAQGYSLADYLVEKRGRKTFLEFLQTAHQHGWDNALRHHYKFKDIEQLEQKWNNWYMAGSPRLNLPKGDMVADAETKPAEPAEESVVLRGQSPEVSGDAGLGTASDEPTGDESRGKSATASSRESSDNREEAVARSDVSADRAEERGRANENHEKSRLAGGLAEYQLRGRKNAVAAGWEPIPASRRERSLSKAERARPPFVEETALAVRDRPPYAEERSNRERPPFRE
jgi:hypothetical protein